MRTATLQSLARIVSGGTPKTGNSSYWDGSVAWATPADLSKLSGNSIGETARTLSQEGLRSCSAEVLPVGSVLLSSRAPIGLVALNSIPMATNQGFKSLIPDPQKLDSKYLFWWLKANTRKLQNLGVGATFKELSKAAISRIELPLPHLEEQSQIADILDKADALRAKRREAIAHLDSLGQSVFHEMFGSPSVNEHGWPVRRLGEALVSTQYGTSEKSVPVGDIPVLRMGNLTYSGELDLNDLKYIQTSDSTSDKYLLRSGDVLFNRTNSPDLVGKTAMFDEVGPFAFAGYLIRLRCSTDLNPAYLTFFMNTADTKKKLRSMCKSIVGMANINAKEVQTLQIMLPPRTLQEEFAERVRGLTKAREVYRAHLHELDNLFLSLQDRAFKGEL